MMTPAGRIALDVLRRLDVSEENSELPWGGRSPRVLTRAYQKFILEPLGDDAGQDLGELDDVMLDEQYRRFLDG